MSTCPEPLSFSTEIGLLHAECVITEDAVSWHLTLTDGRPCNLHWGMNRRPHTEWVAPAKALQPAGSLPMDEEAIQTPFVPVPNEEGGFTLTLQFPTDCPCRALSFVLFCTEDESWIKHEGDNFSLPIPGPTREACLPSEVLSREKQEGDELTLFPLNHGCELAVLRRETTTGVQLLLGTDADTPVSLHWGMAPRFRHQWTQPDPLLLPTGSQDYDDKSCRSPFVEQGGLARLTLTIPAPNEGTEPRGLNLLLVQPTPETWYKHEGRDIYLPLFDGEDESPFTESHLRMLAEEIIQAEVGKSSWTLMHRFHLCHDLLPTVGEDEDGWSLLFVWLRFSAIRQLDWQRHYNTKPRDLSHAQDRLTLSLARLWKEQPTNRWWIRALIATLGRGGEGQQVRDEILNIMHRHHLKEVRGTFMEEWHQKLHNNTTPDDIVICEAYLAFLHSNGSVDTFWQTLKGGGVTRERLAALERPITTDPIFHPEKRDGLSGDFEHYLTILKGVHQGTDFASAIDNATPHLSPALAGRVGEIRSQYQNHTPAEVQIQTISAARCELKHLLGERQEESAIRDLLFLDLALDIHLRTVVEQLTFEAHERDRLCEGIIPILQNILATLDDPEFERILTHWSRLLAQPRDSQDWALHAKSVAERLANRLQERSLHLFAQVQPKAEYLGENLGVDEWTLPLFSEEVIRGSELFVLSLLLRHLDPLLRTQAGLGGWQVISPGEGCGIVRTTESLIAVQEEEFNQPTVLIADRVSGDEEIPEGVTSVITLDAPDLVSHVAVRARNGHVLFATCYDSETYDHLKTLQDQPVAVAVQGSDVSIEEGITLTPETTPTPRSVITSALPARSEAWALSSDAFTRAVVGGKSNNLTHLRGKLPDSIHLPVSLALPYGTAERVLEDAANRPVQEAITTHLATLDQDFAPALHRIREAYADLQAPAALQESVTAAMQEAGLPELAWDKAWSAICRVWAAKWNDRAVLSRQHQGIPHDHLVMAVLIQEVVRADYAYVIHTANPFTGDPDELFAEVVLGMGETLVGNEPGRALGFTCHRHSKAITLHAYPGKATGLYGSGIIFRSDSNGEDLEGFAGAGLYDSFTATPAERRPLDYGTEPLIWDPDFRNALLLEIAETGWAVEALCDTPQDIEGAIEQGRNVVVQTRPQV
ncbi:MAG: phosphohistidine-like domain-containing protein, partial [Planctomycetota bacterium]